MYEETREAEGLAGTALEDQNVDGISLPGTDEIFDTKKDFDDEGEDYNDFYDDEEEKEEEDEEEEEEEDFEDEEEEEEDYDDDDDEEDEF